MEILACAAVGAASDEWAFVAMCIPLSHVCACVGCACVRTCLHACVRACSIFVALAQAVVIG